MREMLSGILLTKSYDTGSISDPHPLSRSYQHTEGNRNIALALMYVQQRTTFLERWMTLSTLTT